MSMLQLLRISTASLVILIIVAGLVGEFKYGVLCSPDVWQFAVTDPMGFVLRTVDFGECRSLPHVHWAL